MVKRIEVEVDNLVQEPQMRKGRGIVVGPSRYGHRQRPVAGA